MRTRTRPIIRDYVYPRSRRYLRVQCEPYGMKFIARYYPDDFPTVAAARTAARKLCDKLEPVLTAAYATNKRDPRKYFGKSGPAKSSSLPAGLSYEPAGFPHRYVVVRWQASGRSQLKRFRLRHGRFPAILKAARNFRRDRIREEKLRVTEHQAVIGQRLRQVFATAKTAGAHVVIMG